MDTSLVFGIIFTSIVIGLLLYFGFDYINKMLFINCDSQIGQQMVNLKNVVKTTLSLSKGSSREIELIMPGCAKKICFVDPEHPEAYNEGGWKPDEFTEYLVSRQKYNFLIIKSDDKIEGFQIEKMKPYVNFCITSSEKVIVRNIGTLAEITLPEF